MTGVEAGAGPGTFSAEVVDIRELARVAGRQLWQVALDHTEFDVIAAGEPAGSLQAVSRSGATLMVKVLAVQREETGQIWHTVDKPIQPGTLVCGRIGS